MNLLVDIGNTRVKYCYSDKEQLSEVTTVDHDTAITMFYKEVDSSLATYAIVSSTASEKITQALVSMLSEKMNVHVLSEKSRLPFEMGYDTPDTLGYDRMANTAAALHFFPNQTSLIIDIGTCITYDVISKGTTYLGGAITPGLVMRFKAMNDYSARLPRLKNIKNNQFPGTSTEGSLESGVFYGILGEIHQFIEETEQSFGSHNVLITGGDCFRFEEGIKYPTFANPKLTLWGLNEILRANI